MSAIGILRICAVVDLIEVCRQKDAKRALRSMG